MFYCWGCGSDRTVRWKGRIFPLLIFVCCPLRFGETFRRSFAAVFKARGGRIFWAPCLLFFVGESACMQRTQSAPVPKNTVALLCGHLSLGFAHFVRLFISVRSLPFRAAIPAPTPNAICLSVPLRFPPSLFVYLRTLIRCAFLEGHWIVATIWRVCSNYMRSQISLTWDNCL